MPDPLHSRPATRTYIGTVETVSHDTYEIELPVDIDDGAARDALRDAANAGTIEPTNRSVWNRDVLDLEPA